MKGEHIGAISIARQLAGLREFARDEIGPSGSRRRSWKGTGPTAADFAHNSEFSVGTQGFGRSGIERHPVWVSQPATQDF
ncbi:MAG TPA: hypothetical protein DHW67_00785 [Agrobacterium sp.]|nr:hypothetical protein [Agrobacterium sp.]